MVANNTNSRNQNRPGTFRSTRSGSSSLIQASLGSNMTPQMVWKMPLIRRANSKIETSPKHHTTNFIVRRWKSLSGILRPQADSSEKTSVVSRVQAKQTHILSSQAMTASSPRTSYAAERPVIFIPPYGEQGKSEQGYFEYKKPTERSNNLLTPEYMLDMYVVPSRASSIRTNTSEGSLTGS